jgi:sugar lactone lactonase YvrE
MRRLFLRFSDSTCLLACSLAFIALGSHISMAVTLNPGDILVADSGAGAIIRINPITGGQAAIFSGGAIVSPVGIALGTNGNVFVADLNADVGQGVVLRGGVFEINPSTDTQMLISAVSDPNGIAIATNGDVLVTQNQGLGRLVRISPSSGTQTVVTSGGLLTHSMSVAVASNGTVYVTNGFGDTDVVGVNLEKGTQTAVSSNQDYRYPDGIVVATNGDIYLADLNMSAGPGGVFRVDPLTGQQTLIASGGIFNNPAGIAIDADGNVVVSDYSAAAIIRVDPATGTQTIICTNGLLKNPTQIVIVPGVPQANEDTNHIPPTINILRPANGMLYSPDTNQTITIVSSATAYDGADISKIEFFLDGLKIGETASNPGTNLFSPVTLGTHILTAVAIDTLLSSNISSVATITVGAKNSPVGIWEVTVSGADKGVQFLRFQDDFSAIGFGFRLKTFGLADVSGHWGFNSVGAVTGPFIEETLGTTNWRGTLLGATKYLKGFTATVSTDSETFRWKGAPATITEDVSGPWTGVITVVKTATVVNYVINSNSDESGILDIATNDDPSTTIGKLLVTSHSKVYGYVTFNGKSYSCSGTFNAVRHALTLKGKSETGEKISVKIYKQ